MGVSREQETHLPVSQCLAKYGNMMGARYLFVTWVNESISDQTLHKWFRLERTGKWPMKSKKTIIFFQLNKGIIWVANKKNKACGIYLYLFICFRGLKQFLSKHNKWKECCLCKWDRKKRQETNCTFVLETTVLPYKGPRLKTHNTAAHSLIFLVEELQSSISDL